MAEKCSFLVEHAKGRTVEELCKSFGIGQTSAYEIIKKKSAIMEEFNSGTTSLTKKRGRKSVYDDVDEKLLAWYVKAHEDVQRGALELITDHMLLIESPGNVSV